MALKDMNLRPEEVAMIGDDIITDIAGARKAGMKTILVKTGKFHQESLQNAVIKPTYVIDSIAGLSAIL